MPHKSNKEYVNQHFLPAAYLCQFSDHKRTFTRKSYVWRHDKKGSVLVKAETQCAPKYHYSKTEPKRAEATFHEIEKLYPKCVAAIRAQRTPTSQQFMGLVIMTFDLYVRNPVHMNETGQENIDAYHLRFRAFAENFIMETRTENATDEMVYVELKRRWWVRIISSYPGTEFITSDSPVVLFAGSEHRKGIDFAVLPVTPSHLAVVYDKHRLSVPGSTANELDQKVLNESQCRYALECVYSSGQLNDEEIEYVQRKLALKRHLGATRKTSWSVPMKAALDGFRFSFLGRSCGT
jgi:hypothetical protein